MTTRLEKPISRLVELDGVDWEVTLDPQGGGQVVLREKGKRGEKHRRRTAIADLLGMKKTPVTAVASRDGQTGNPDLVDLADLERRIMVEGETFLEPGVKGKLWSLIRDVRNQRRENLGMKSVRGEG